MARILVVDDDPAQRARLKQVLETAGHAVTTATDAIQGLVTVTRDPPDLILSDILMPRMDGFTFIREMKSRPELRAIPFLFVTSTLVSEEDRQFAQMLGAEASLARADDVHVALNVIEACLKRHTRGARQTPPAPPAPVVTENQTATAPAPDETGPAQSLQPSREQQDVQLEGRIAELEQANRRLEQRVLELAALAAERDELLQQASRSTQELHLAHELRQATLAQVAKEREQLIQTAGEHSRELEQRVQDRRRHLAALANISRAINATLKPEAILDQIVQSVTALIEIDACNLFLFNPDTGAFHGAASSTLPRESIRKLYFSAQDEAPVNLLIQEHTFIALDESDHNRSVHSFPMLEQAFHARAALITPVVVHGQVLGVLMSIDSNAHRVFKPEEIELLTIFADQAGSALEHARLFYEATHALDELSAAQQQLSQAEKLAAAIELAGAAVHELSQPLTLMLAQTVRLKQYTLSPELQQELLLVETQTQRMVEIVDQMRRITRYETRPYLGSTRIVDLPRSADH